MKWSFLRRKRNFWVHTEIIISFFILGRRHDSISKDLGWRSRTKTTCRKLHQPRATTLKLSLHHTVHLWEGRAEARPGLPHRLRVHGRMQFSRLCLLDTDQLPAPSHLPFRSLHKGGQAEDHGREAALHLRMQSELSMRKIKAMRQSRGATWTHGATGDLSDG